MLQKFVRREPTQQDEVSTSVSDDVMEVESIDASTHDEKDNLISEEKCNAQSSTVECEEAKEKEGNSKLKRKSSTRSLRPLDGKSPATKKKRLMVSVPDVQKDIENVANVKRGNTPRQKKNSTVLENLPSKTTKLSSKKAKTSLLTAFAKAASKSKNNVAESPSNSLKTSSPETLKKFTKDPNAGEVTSASSNVSEGTPIATKSAHNTSDEDSVQLAKIGTEDTSNDDSANLSQSDRSLNDSRTDQSIKTPKAAKKQTPKSLQLEEKRKQREEEKKKKLLEKEKLRKEKEDEKWRKEEERARVKKEKEEEVKKLKVEKERIKEEKEKKKQEELE